MQLSMFSDYALRILMHLANAEGHMLTTRQIAGIHDAKYNHLAKVTQWLVRENYVVSVRGRAGGLRLAQPIEKVSVGLVLRKLEDPSALVECLRGDGGACVLSPRCTLTSYLRIAQEAFYMSLDSVTLADLTLQSKPMSDLLSELNGLPARESE